MLKNHRTELERGLATVTAIADRMGRRDSVDQVTEDIARQLQTYEPSVMVYGVYNAGKSTLINALVGEELAAASDAPCTTTVQELRFGDYRLFDTPGLDAPLEHEAVSRSHLDRCDVVLFVVSTHGLADEARTVETLTDVVRSGRPVLLVLHDKAGLGVDSDEVREMAAGLLSHLARELGESVRNAVEVFVVNARSAQRARDAAKHNLLHASGVPQLAAALARRLAETNELELLAAPVGRLRRLVFELEEHIQNEVDDAELSALMRAKGRLEAARAGFIASAQADLISERVGFQAALGEALDRGGPLDPAAQRYATRIGRDWNQCAMRTYDELSGVFEDLAVELSARREVAQPTVEFSDPLVPANPEAQPAEHNLIAQLITKEALRDVGSKAASPQGTQVIKDGFLKLRRLKMPGFKGRWERTLGRWAGKAGRWAGPLIDLGIAAYDVKQTLAAHKAQEEAARQRREQIATRTTQLVADVETDALEQATAAAAAMVDPIAKQLRSLIRSNEAMARAQTQDLRQLGLLARALNGIRSDIRAHTSADHRT